jgi:hypothetical protein
VQWHHGVELLQRRRRELGGLRVRCNVLCILQGEPKREKREREGKKKVRMPISIIYKQPKLTRKDEKKKNT